MRFLSDCMDEYRVPVRHLGMAQRPQQYRKTFIRQWRKFRGLTLERLADRVGMTAGNLSNLERGVQGYTQPTLENLAEALGTDPASLLMRDPTHDDSLWTLWEQAKPGERHQIVEHAKVILRTGTGD